MSGGSLIPIGALAALIARCDARGDAADQPGCPLIETLLGTA